MATTDLGKWMITNGGNYDPEATYEQLTMVMYENSTYITLRTVTGITPSNDNQNYILMAQGFNSTALSSIQAEDTSGLLGEPGENVSAQSLIDYLADAVATKLLKKTDIATSIENSNSSVPASSLLYQLNSDLSSNKQISSEEILNPEGDLTGYIDGQTAVNLGIEQHYYSVWGHYNGGNSTQILVPLDEAKTPFIRVKRPSASYDINYRLLTDADEINIQKLAGNIQIYNGDVLNTSISPGVYAVNSENPNLPIPTYGIIFVIKNNNWIFVFFVPTDLSGLYVIFHNSYGESWSSWKHVNFSS